MNAKSVRVLPEDVPCKRVREWGEAVYVPTLRQSEKARASAEKGRRSQAWELDLGYCLFNVLGAACAYAVWIHEVKIESLGMTGFVWLIVQPLYWGRRIWRMWRQ